MDLLSLVLLALLAASVVQSGLPRYTRGKLVLIDENLQSEAPDKQSLAAEEDYWPDVELEMVQVVSLKDQNCQTTPESYVIKDQDHEGDSTVWKVALVAVVLLASILGCLSLTYYLCVWRGGRVRYQLQKPNHAFI